MSARILVPLDGSAFAESALPVALAVGRRSGGAIELVAVQEPAPPFAYEEWELASRDWSESYLAEAARRAREASGVEVTTTVLRGRVADALARRTVESDADLVVMATHGRGALTRAWLGSVADSFVRHTDRPVLLVRPDDEEEQPPDPAGNWALGHVLIALDGSDLSRAIVGPAVRLGSLFDARYTLLRVVMFPVELASPYLPHTVQMNRDVVEEARAAAQRDLEGLAEELRGKGLRVEADVEVDGQAAHAILDQARELGAHLIALATHGRGGVTRAVLGSTADKVIRGAHRPVLVLRPPSAE